MADGEHGRVEQESRDSLRPDQQREHAMSVFDEGHGVTPLTPARTSVFVPQHAHGCEQSRLKEDDEREVQPQDLQIPPWRSDNI